MQKERKRFSIDVGIGLAWIAILFSWITWAAPNIGLDGIAGMVKALLIGQYNGLHPIIKTNSYTWLISIGYWVGVFFLALVISMFIAMYVRDILKPLILDIRYWIKNLIIARNNKRKGKE